MRSARTPRLARGVLAASTATFVALLSHAVAGGAMPGWLGILVPWVLSVMVCTLLAGRRLSLLRLSAAVAISQVLFHTLFVLGAGTGGSGVAATAHDHGSMGSMGAMSAMTSMSTDAATAAGATFDPVMWLGHLVAAVVTIAVLYRGERAMRRLHELAGDLRAWVRSRFDVPRPLPLLPSTARFPGASDVVHVSSVPQRSALHHRGPPLARAL